MPPTGHLISCGDIFPSDFLCPTGTSCIPLKSDYSSALCCPLDQDCSRVTPISCDVSDWNATVVPYSQVHSSAAVSLIQCGQECCPVGYDCQSQQCVKGSSKERLVQTSVKTSQPVQTSKTTARPTPTKVLHNPGRTTSATSIRTSLTHTASPSNTNQPNKSYRANTGNLNTTTGALIGVLAALFAVVVVALVVWYLHRRSKSLKQTAAESRVRQLTPPKTKAEPGGVRAPLTVLAPIEMTASRSPRELSPVHMALQKEIGVLRYTRYPPGGTRRPWTLNSIPQELEVEAEKAEWI